MEYTKKLSNNNSIQFGRSSFRKQKLLNEAFTLSFIFKGKEDFEIKNKNLTVFPDSFLAIAEGTCLKRSINNSQPVEFFTVSYDKAYYSNFINSCLHNDTDLLGDNARPYFKTSFFHETLHPFIGDLKYNVGHLRKHILYEKHDELLIDEYLHHCLLTYYNFFVKDLLAKSKGMDNMKQGTKNEILKRVNLAKDYIYSNYNTNVNLKDLAFYSSMSVPHLLRSFKKVYNITPHQLLIKLRLQRARRILKHSDFPVNEVVKIVGFESTSTFIKLFRQKYEQTPLHYRQSA